MSVYFIQLGRYLKVGYSETPERRHRRLFSGTTSYSAPWDCPRGLADRTLLGYVPLALLLTAATVVDGALVYRRPPSPFRGQR